MKTEPRLKFTAEDRAAPEMKKPIQKAEKAAAKADKAQAKIPKKAVRERVVDPATGKVKTKLTFTEKKTPSKLSHDIRAAPVNTASVTLHRAIRQNNEDDNVGLATAHSVEGGTEAGARLISSKLRSSRLRPYRRAAAAEERLEKANLNVLTKKAQMEQPASNPLSKRLQRNAIKKQYAAAKAGKAAGTTQNAMQATGKAAEKAAEGIRKTAQFVRQHKKGFLIAGALLLMLSFLLNMLSSCSVMVESIGSSVAASTYPSKDADMLGAEAAYAGMEAELQDYLDTYEETHEYDEYSYDLDEIEHDPYVLISMLTAWKRGAWELDDVEDALQMLFDQQYILTETVEWEERTREVDGTEETYDYSICTVKLVNFNLSHVPIYIMDQDQLSLYAMYMGTLGNRTDLFPVSEYIPRYVVQGYTTHEIPAAALENETFAAMIEEAEKYLGYPYVWGGSSPATSFDCSGFVSWVINHSGWNVGRLGAQGLYNICTRTNTPVPGDLVFFTGTYDAGVPVSHVGLYVGDGWMIHCGDPISYIQISGSYYQSHFYAYGRLPAP